jgi:radical SAM-linked protein
MKGERLYFLRRMNAWTPAVAAPARPRPVEGALHRGGSPRPPTRVVQGERHRYRLRYTKVGRVVYLGHLDLIRHLPRIFRRAGLELFYSTGFHPKPEFSFSPALGLGVPGLAEILDVSLAEAVDPDTVLRLLNSATLDGITFLDIAALDEADLSLGQVLSSTQYAAHLRSAAAVDAALTTFASAAPLFIVRPASDDSKKTTIGRRLDVRQSVAAVTRPPETTAVRLATDFNFAAQNTIVWTCHISTSGTARPREFLEAVAGPQTAADAEIVRIGLWAASSVDPLDLRELRARASRSLSQRSRERPDLAPGALATTCSQ